MSKLSERTSTLSFRIIASVIFLLVVFSTVVSGIGYFRFTNAIVSDYRDFSYRISQTAASYINADHLELYLETNGDDDEYRATNDQLTTLCETQEATFVYAIVPDVSDYGEYTVVFNVTSEGSGYTGDDVWSIGHVQPTTNDEYRDIYRGIYEDGLTCETVVRDTELNGADPHLNTLAPLVGSDGEVKGIIAVQISMNELIQGRKTYLRWVGITLLSCIVATCVVATIFFKSQIVGPIQTVTREAHRFAIEATPAEEGLLADISRINEIKTLASSIDKMEKDTLEHIDNLTAATAEKERIGYELSLAQRIQNDMLPNIFPPYPGRTEFDVFASMMPAKEVGGDFYDFFLVDDDHLALVIADVSGKGVPAALFMMVSKILVQNYAMTGTSPSVALEVMNDQICANNHEEMFVTVWLGVLELSTGKLIAANAGHEDPFIKKPGGDFEVLRDDRHGFVIGGMAGMSYRDYELKLEPGSKLFVYTDGVVEATNDKGELFGMDRALDAVNAAADESPEAILHATSAAVESFVGDAEQFDDLTMLCVEYHGRDADSSPAKVRTFEALIDNVDDVTDFVNEELESMGCPMKEQFQIDVAIDEIFSNIARYAYAPGTGNATVIVEPGDQPRSVRLTFIDSGTPYNPLEHEDPDIGLPAEQRETGGLGIFIVKNTMDDVSYEHANGNNVLRFEKRF